MSTVVPQHTETIATLTLRRVSSSGSTHHALTAHGGGLSGPAIAVIVLAGLLALACLAWGLARALAFEPRWVQYARHSVAEAQVRASSICAELGDWIRLGH